MARLALNGFTTVSGTERIKRGAGPVRQGVVVLNDFSGLAAFERRDRTLKSGKTKSRFTVSIRSEPLLHNFDGISIGRRPAEAMAKVLQRKIGEIGARASDSTLVWRQAASRAFARGAKWARDRYAGGRTGAMPPQVGSQRLFTDSGRLAKTLIARENKVEGTWTINVAANRFDVRTFRGEGELSAMVDRLRQHVPELGDAGKLGRDREVREAVASSINDVIRKAKMVNAEKKQQLRAQLVQLAGAGLRGLLG